MGPVICMITGARRESGAWEDALVARVHEAAHDGVHLVQVREPDLDARALTTLVERCVRAVEGTGARVLVNDRTDVALAAGAHGVHLRADSVPAARVRALVPRPFVIGRSVHSREEAVAVSAAGALDFLIFGTVFESASKPGRPAAGVEALREVTTATSLPVLAVGGMTRERWPEVHAVGAAGFAAISLFA